MKKAIISPLCSAFVIPGLGQILNQQLKKGGLLLGSVFVLFIGIMVQLYRLVSSLLKSSEPGSLAPLDIITQLNQSRAWPLLFLIFVLVALWVYSIVDAFFYGLRADRAEGEGLKNEGLPPG